MGPGLTGTAKSFTRPVKIGSGSGGGEKSESGDGEKSGSGDGEKSGSSGGEKSGSGSGMGSLLKSDAAGGVSIGLKGTGQVSVTHRTFIVET